MFTRRHFLVTGAASTAGVVLARALHADEAGDAAVVPDLYPRQGPDLVQEVVAASHGRFDRVRELVDSYPELAKANIDWGFGDWESALGAASHMGRRDIAEVLLSHGARPTIFSAAMLGQLAVVRAFIETSPGVQGTFGPHGLTLLHHARMGKANEVVAYLEDIGGADPANGATPIAPEALAALHGVYRYGSAESETLEVKESRGGISIGRPGQFGRQLIHLKDLEFHAGGAPSTRITFAGTGAEQAVQLVSGTLTIEAKRVTGP